MSSIFNDLAQQAKVALEEEFPTLKININLVQSHYFPSLKSTKFCVVAEIGNMIYVGSGNSVGIAVNGIINEVWNDLKTDNHVNAERLIADSRIA